MSRIKSARMSLKVDETDVPTIVIVTSDKHLINIVILHLLYWALLNAWHCLFLYLCHTLVHINEVDLCGLQRISRFFSSDLWRSRMVQTAAQSDSQTA